MFPFKKSWNEIDLGAGVGDIKKLMICAICPSFQKAAEEGNKRTATRKVKIKFMERRWTQTHPPSMFLKLKI